ncbi:MAG: hypothetical protein JNM69_15845 [Archangium sp.]|nr:hypothetical protein [Archangium sp.]
MAEPVTPPPAAVLPPSDAGSLTSLEVEVFLDGRHAAGQLVELMRKEDRTLVSRPADVMGFARFELAPGAWELTEPMETARTIELKDEALRVTLKLTSPRPFTIRVVDEAGVPAPGAKVTIDDDEAIAGLDGTVHRETRAEQLTIGASTTTAIAVSRVVKVAPEIELRLEPAGTLTVEVEGRSGKHPGWLRLERGLEGVGTFCDFGMPVLVPAGVIRATVRTTDWRGLVRGTGELTVKPGEQLTLVVKTDRQRPITGTVVDSAGTPSSGIGLTIREFESQSPWRASTVTNRAGRFAFLATHLAACDPVFELRVEPPWWTPGRRLLTRLDDEPLTIEVHLRGDGGDLQPR